MELDLRKIIAELMDAGVSQVEIAAHIGVHQPTVSRYADGEIKKCSYPIGAKLIELHQRRVPRAAA